MESFINKDFMLTNESARELYHDSAESLPIIDYHCHLDPKQIAENHSFKLRKNILPETEAIMRSLRNGRKRFPIRCGILYTIGLIWS